MPKSIKWILGVVLISLACSSMTPTDIPPTKSGSSQAALLCQQAAEQMEAILARGSQYLNRYDPNGELTGFVEECIRNGRLD